MRKFGEDVHTTIKNKLKFYEKERQEQDGMGLIN